MSEQVKDGRAADAGAALAGAGPAAEMPLPPSIALAWGRAERPRRGPKPGLSLERIVAAGIGLAVTDGLGSVSMGRVAAELGAQGVARLQQHVHHGRIGLQLVAAQLVQQRLHLVGQLGDVGEAEGRRATLDGVGAAEDGVQLFVVGRLDIHIEQQLLHVVEVLAGFFEEDLVELAEVDAGTDAGSF